MRIVSVVIGVWITCQAFTACAEELNITASGKSQTFTRFWEDYERCKARQEFTPVRGEYETQEEYRQRVEKLRVGCDTLRRVESANIDVPMQLKYDVDAGRFLFELPTTKGMHIQYDALVKDDFPPKLNRLPRDRWHIDDPTPKASAYKECILKEVRANTRYINKLEPCRTDSWRGCMTYYLRDDEIGWRRDMATFFISDVTFYAYSTIEQARQLHVMEKDLIYRIDGVLEVPEQTFQAQRVEIVNRKTGEMLVRLNP